MNSKILYTDKAPRPIGPYSQAIECGTMIFLSGQIPLDPVSGAVTGTTVGEQAVQVLKNITAVLESQGLSMNAIVKATVFLRDMAAFGEFNAVYEEHLCGWKPARSVVEVSNLPKNVLIEIEVVACR